MSEYVKLCDVVRGIESYAAPVADPDDPRAKKDRKEWEERRRLRKKDSGCLISFFIGTCDKSQALIQALHSEFARNRPGLPKFFIKDEQTQVVRLADNQEKAWESVINSLVHDIQYDDHWWTSKNGDDIYFYVGEIATFLEKHTISHRFRERAPAIPIMTGDAEDPKWNLMLKKPARLRSILEGPSLIKFNTIRDLRNGDEETTLTKYLKLGSWTPAMAAMLTCGLQPKIGETEIPNNPAIGLWYRGNTKVTPNNCSFFKEAEELFELFSYQFPHVSKVNPEEWITWCGEQEIRCNWLIDIPLARDWVLYLEAEAEAKCVNIPPDERWNERWTAPPSCSVEGKTRFEEGSNFDSCSDSMGQQQGKTGGRSKGSLREAVEFLFDKFAAEGNTEILQRGKINEFIERLRDSIIPGNRNFSEYIAERIREVKKPGGRWKITTQRKEISKNKYIESLDKDTNSIAKILTDLRQKNPLTP
jgi:hypothetical protein